MKTQATKGGAAPAPPGVMYLRSGAADAAAARAAEAEADEPLVAGSAWLLALENWVPGTCGGGRGFAEFGGGGGGAVAAAALAVVFGSLLLEEAESAEFFLPS